jgi:excisionase family DNA binding protein
MEARMHCEQVEAHFVPLAVSSNPRWLLTNIVARRLSLSRRTVRHLAQKGALKGQKRGKKLWQFLEEDVEAFRIQREALYAE